MIVLVVFLFVVALENLLPLRGRAEAARFEQTLGALRSAMHLQFTEAVLDRGMARVPALARENPMHWLRVAPPGYAGERADPAPADIPPGGWIFDTAGRQLVYRVRYPAYFTGGTPDNAQMPLIRLSVRLRYTDRNGDGEYRPGTDALHGVALVALDDYAWVEPAGSETLRLLGLAKAGEERE